MEAVATSVDITPSRLLPTACHGPFNTPAREIALPLEANVLALREDGRTLVIVSLDWFYASPGLRACILKRCEGRVDEASLFVAASHAHTSPPTDRTKVGFSAVDEAYLASVENAIAERVNQLLVSEKWEMARLRYAAVPCDCAIHRRRRVWKVKRFRIQQGISFYPNAEGPRDRELRLLRVEDESGRLLCVMWGISCHPTEWPRLGELSSDYPGGVREALRATFGRELPVLFLQGFAGDLRPPAVGRWMKNGPWSQRLLLLASSFVNGPCFAGFTPQEYEAWQAGIIRAAQQATAQAAGAEPLKTRLAVHRNGVALSTLGLSGETPALTVHWFDLAERLRVVGISAEACWEYADLLKRAFPGKTVWPVGYIDSVFGYLPTQSMLREGGYEVTGFREAFGIKGEFVANLEQIVKELVQS